MNDSVYRTGKNYYPRVFLEECKYVVQEKKMPEYITDKIEISSDNPDEESSDEENSYSRMCLGFIFDVSNDSSLYIAKKSYYL